ncbi:MAG: gluconate 2-dehydrogenase subunit 3 family protein [Rhodothermales bacterium]|nr:gluconate 2-dehydrogenase subunit 3 family protein [Rhodothermales bacterium]
MSNFGSGFTGSSSEQQETLVASIARNESANGPMPDALHGFFRTVKELTVVGYYTSETGGAKELRLMPLGDYRADVPYDEIGRAWS